MSRRGKVGREERRRIDGRSLATGALGAVLLLAGCANPTPSVTMATPDRNTPLPTPTGPVITSTPSLSATPTTTPSGVPTPVDDATRRALVVPAYRDYWAAIDDMRNAGGSPEPTPAMLRTMAGVPLLHWADVARAWSLNTVYSEGRYEVVAASARDVSLSEASGSAFVDYCVDTSQASFHRRDGITPPAKAPERYRQGSATMSWQDGSWKVIDAKEVNRDECTAVGPIEATAPVPETTPGESPSDSAPSTDR